VRVLFLAHSFPRRPGDAPGSFLLRLARALADAGIDVQVVAPAAPGLAAAEELEGIPVTRFRYAPRRWETLAYTGNMAEDVRRSTSAKLALAGFLAAEGAAARRAAARFRPDVLHAHWWFPNGLAATLPGAPRAIPLVTTFHGSDVRLARSVPAARAPLRRVVRHSAVLTAVSRWLADEARAAVPEARPVVAPMPVATELFTPGGQRDARRLLFVGRLNAQKGIETLLRALARAARSATLDVVGDGPDRDRLHTIAAELGVAERVRWLGALPQDRLPELYRRAAALVVPSTGEGLGLVAVEAMLCETPVVAYRSGGLLDVVEDGRTGLLVEPGDPALLARALDDVLDRPDAAALGREGRRRAREAFSPAAAARRYAEIYHEAASRRAAATV
jgi:glycosyltransferase involved in cell wall biosynthesis